jgi:HSP20 family protein
MFVFPTSIASTRRASPVLLSRAIDHLFNDRYANDAPEQPRVPSLDVTESDTSYTLLFDLPGFTREQLNVTVQGRRVSVEASVPAQAEAKEGEGERLLYRERSAARYARTVSLPAEVDQATSTAKFENGVLFLTLAKKVPTGATRININ